MRLEKRSLDLDPVAQFRVWFKQAKDKGCLEPTAMALATAGPSVRMVLLKHFDAQGFVFFTNYKSRKSLELEENPKAALNFWWPQLKRQLLIEGDVVKCSRDEGESYFATRPRVSQLGAWASSQDAPISSREELIIAFTEREREFEGKPIPCPLNWGGWRVIPSRFEFWQEGEGRLHDRFEYRKESGSWVISRLSP